ncbi:Hypothetical predicted protein [Mytilus galloprovincialis]|uniref:Uncharacterized protein n=1 Tax=Mytilus galloprovincialis TaxID=29158 RepID=A0A8B6BYY9_MYTGA|nr:Hypothetical predicted protein [Mytilus galloprovincialis]
MSSKLDNTWFLPKYYMELVKILVCGYEKDVHIPEFLHRYKVIVRGSIDGETCKKNFYQPFKFNSHGNSGCVYKISVCTEEGQVVYRNGNFQTDSVCRCDDSKGYAFICQPQPRCYCVPAEEDCSCYFKKCSPDNILSKGI